MENSFTESVVEDATLAWLGELGPACRLSATGRAGRYAVLHGPEIEPEGPEEGIR